jgi:putative copper resistance protein D
VAALAASGLVNGWLILGGLEGLQTATYGRLLLAKVAVFAAMLGAAAINRFWLAPAFARQPGEAALKRLRLAVAAENALGLGVLVLVAILGTLDPLP